MFKLVKYILKKLLIILGVDISRCSTYIQHIKGEDIITNIYNTAYMKNCLIIYITYPFCKKETSDTHQNQVQVKLIAKVLEEYGYNIDVMSIDSKNVILTKKYDLILDIHPGKFFLGNNMAKDCIRIAYLTGMNPSFANEAENDRLLEVYNRRGVKLPQERQCENISKDIEKYNAFFYIGNSYNVQSYSEFKLPPIYYMRNTGYKFQSTNFEEKKSNNFLFFASEGQVHKGLDLLLEVFSKEKFPCNLYICSGVLQEKEFCECYEKELYSMENIHTVGFVNIWSEDFQAITNICSYVIVPSCSEGISGAVLTCMSAGLIPIVSRECGFDDKEVINLPDCAVQTIEKYILCYSKKKLAWIEMKARETINVVNSKYTNKDFVEIFRAAIEDVFINEGVFKKKSF